MLGFPGPASAMDSRRRISIGAGRERAAAPGGERCDQPSLSGVRAQTTAPSRRRSGLCCRSSRGSSCREALGRTDPARRNRRNLQSSCWSRSSGPTGTILSAISLGVVSSCAPQPNHERPMSIGRPRRWTAGRSFPLPQRRSGRPHLFPDKAKLRPKAVLEEGDEDDRGGEGEFVDKHSNPAVFRALRDRVDQWQGSKKVAAGVSADVDQKRGVGA